jgi:lycopene beta-cyclase
LGQQNSATNRIAEFIFKTAMNNHNRYDIIIAGAGAAGLTLLFYLLQSGISKERKILVVDKSLAPDGSKTWCFWDDGNISLADLIFHEWKALTVSASGSTFSENLKEYHYHCVRSLDYSTTIIERASLNDNISFLEAEIIDFSSNGDTSSVHTSAGEYQGYWIFQSVLHPPGYHNTKVDISLLQHFIGWEIETDRPVFDPETATLMDFNTSQENGVTFFYVLPFSKTKALIEYTLFSEKLLETRVYEDALEHYIQENFGLYSKNYSITRVEKGAIPMEDRQYPQWYCSRVMNTGTAGGYTKPSTGYTFSRLHDVSKKIVGELEKGYTIPDIKASGYRFRVYDMMLLYLLKNESDMSVRIFRDLFKKNKFDRILQFLDEKTNFLQELGIFSTLPYTPFFRSIYKMKHRIFTGA